MNELFKKVAIGIVAGLVSMLGAVLTDLDAWGKQGEFDWVKARRRYMRAFLAGFLPAVGFTGAAGALGLSV